MAERQKRPGAPAPLPTRMTPEEKLSRQACWRRLLCLLPDLCRACPELVEARVAFARKGRSAVVWARVPAWAARKRCGGWRCGTADDDRRRGYAVVTMSEAEVERALARARARAV